MSKEIIASKTLGFYRMVSTLFGSVFASRRTTYTQEEIQRTRGLSYSSALRNIEQSPNPIGIALDYLFADNGINSQIIIDRQLTAGVEMFFDEIQQPLLPKALVNFIKNIVPTRSTFVQQMTALRQRSGVVSEQSYNPYIGIDLTPDPEMASQVEKERGWVVSDKKEEALGGYLAIDFVKGRWRWMQMTVPIRPWLAHEEIFGGYEEGTVDIQVIRDIAGLIPNPPLTLGNVCNPSRRIVISPRC